jgi:hypothetical protein
MLDQLRGMQAAHRRTAVRVACIAIQRADRVRLGAHAELRGAAMSRVGAAESGNPAWDTACPSPP